MSIDIYKLNGFSDEHGQQFFRKQVLIKYEISEELKKTSGKYPSIYENAIKIR